MANATARHEFFLVQAKDKNTKDECSLLLHGENLDTLALETGLHTVAAAGTSRVAGRTPMSYTYRKMGQAEFGETIGAKKLTHQRINKKGIVPPRSEKWLTESLDHTRTFANAGVPAGETEHVVEFGMPRKDYMDNIRGHSKPQKPPAGARATPDPPGRPKNLLNVERIESNKKGKVNIGLKGPANVDTFNESLVHVKKINENAFMNKTEALRWTRRNKVAVGCVGAGIILDGVNITLAIVADGGTFGEHSTTATMESVGSNIGAWIGSVLGSAFPVIGNIICGTIGALIGGLILGGIARLIFSLIPRSAQGPGAPLLDCDPYCAVFGAPSLGLDLDHHVNQPVDGVFGAPSLGLSLDQGFPATGYRTRKDP